MLGLGMGELAIISVVLFLIFGAKRLPELGSALGQSIKNFKGSLGKSDVDKVE